MNKWISGLPLLSVMLLGGGILPSTSTAAGGGGNVSATVLTPLNVVEQQAISLGEFLPGSISTDFSLATSGGSLTPSSVVAGAAKSLGPTQAGRMRVFGAAFQGLTATATAVDCTSGDLTITSMTVDRPAGYVTGVGAFGGGQTGGQFYADVLVGLNITLAADATANNYSCAYTLTATYLN